MVDSQGCTVTERKAICKLLNEHFTNVGPKMDAKIAKTAKMFNIFSSSKSFYSDPITPHKVVEQLHQLDPSKACGPENIPNQFCKMIGPIIASYLSDIFNACYDQEIYPSILKHTKMIPIHKSGNRNIATNYRPISILCAVSKVFEKLLYKRIEKFLSLNNTFTERQFGFRKGYSLKWH